MLEQGSGVILHVSSIQRRMPFTDSLPYAAAKAALTNYSKGLAFAVLPPVDDELLLHFLFACYTDHELAPSF